MPDVWALPTSDAIREGLDFKALKVKELIAAAGRTVRHNHRTRNSKDEKGFYFLHDFVFTRSRRPGFTSAG